MQFRITTYPTVGSTNAVARQMGLMQAPEGTVVAALTQTAGKGRLGRSFYSPAGTGIYFSLLLRPSVPLAPGVLTAMGGVAVCRVLKGYGLCPQIKWVNDVFLQGKKVCGILAEQTVLGPNVFTVVGFGLNLCPPENGFPHELTAVAGTVFDRAVPRERGEELQTALLREYARLYEALPDLSFRQEYADAGLLTGQTVTVDAPEGVLTGLVTGIGEDFSLLVQTPDGTVHPIRTGEATIGSRQV